MKGRVKGWVYVISNKGMPNIIKVGHSMKDPELRARELAHTGSPHPYVVEYDMLVENPQQIEQQVHCILSHYREGKEWFRCLPAEAIAAVRQVCGDRIILESFKKVSCEKAGKLDRERESVKMGGQEEKARIEAELRARKERAERIYTKALRHR